jgi:two-component system NarL family sensor kinase
MYLRKKIFLFAIMPLLLALFATALTIYFQATSLAHLQRATIEPVYRANKEAELRNYVALAEQSIASFYENERDDDAKEKAKDLLRRLKFGEDGYFFVNDFDGKILVQPNQPYREGKTQLDRRDSTGTLIIQKLINVAHNGGGFVEYTMEKPSVRKVVPKLAYVIALPKWEWVLGTGIYLDDVDVVLEEIDRQVADNIIDTMIWIVSISFLSLIAIFFGLLLNIKERTITDDKLSEANANLAALTKRLINAREEERQRIEYLYNGVQSMLTAIKMNIEVALSKSSHLIKDYVPFRLAAEALGSVLADLHKIIKGESISDPKLSLAAQLNKLTLDMSNIEMPINFIEKGETKDLALNVKEALYMTAKPALENVIKHARARHISVRLEGTISHVKLEICDDGIGFDYQRVSRDSSTGIGLRSMREGLRAVRGNLSIHSTSHGTSLVATVPYH